MFERDRETRVGCSRRFPAAPRTTLARNLRKSALDRPRLAAHPRLPCPFDQAPKTDAPAGAAEPKVVTTELIQKYLDENQQLILAILENQNVGKLQECAQYQARLQQNLMYLAAIADAAPAQAKQQ